MIAAIFSVVLLVQSPVTIATEDGGQIEAVISGKGRRGVVLAHGGRLTKESWRPQAEVLEKAGFRVLAFDFRGHGKSRGPSQNTHLDVLAAVRYLRKNGCRSVYAIGGSFGGFAVADALAMGKPGEIQRLVLLGTSVNDTAAPKLTGRKLFIIARDDANDAGFRLPGVQANFAKTPEPKQLIILDGNAHAQFLFQSDQSERVMREILSFLTAP
jgi:alpha/beta superfamily hydrolase